MKLKLNKKIINRVIIYSGFVCLIIISIFIIDIAINLRKQERQSVLWLFQNTDWKKMARIESEYTAFMYDIINIMSSKSRHSSMSKEMRIKYTTENFKLAKAFGYGYYDITILGSLESDLNPFAGDKEHLLGEVGMFGQCYQTARYYYFIGEDLLPARLWKIVKFNFNKKSDLKDPINALKMTYIWLWIEYYNYDGIEMCAISGYHWGKWYWKYWKNGTGEFPVRFDFYSGHKKYTRNPKAYYFTWKKIKTSLERGDIDTAKTIHNLYKKKKDKLKYEEIEYRRLYSVMKAQKKQLKEMEKTKALWEKEIKKYKELNDREIKVMRQIGGEAKKGGWKEPFKKVIKFCKGKANGNKD